MNTTTPFGNVNGLESFVPGYNGTYIVKAVPVAQGYCVVEGETLFIVERQSSLVIETETVDNITMIRVETDLGGAVEDADVVVNGYSLKTDEHGEVEFSSINVSQLVIQAERFGFNPAVVSVNLQLLKGDLNADGEITPKDVSMALDIVFGGEFVIEADVDENGYVNILDVRMIMLAAAGRIEL